MSKIDDKEIDLAYVFMNQNLLRIYLRTRSN
jgi:hypothetical protein